MRCFSTTLVSHIQVIVNHYCPWNLKWSFFWRQIIDFGTITPWTKSKIHRRTLINNWQHNWELIFVWLIIWSITVLFKINSMKLFMLKLFLKKPCSYRICMFRKQHHVFYSFEDKTDNACFLARRKTFPYMDHEGSQFVKWVKNFQYIKIISNISI